MEGQESQGSIASSTSTTEAPSELSSAVESIKAEAPKLSGLDKLKSDKAHVEKTGTVPPKSGEKVTPAAVPAAPAAVEKSAYTPDYKYKASGKEMEIPEKFRALITDKESEEEIKKLFGQAGTLDEVKTDNATLKKNLGEVGGALNQMQTGVQKLRSYAQKDDFDSFFKGVNIDPERIYKWVLGKVQYNQLPPEQRAQIDQQRNLQMQNEQAQERIGQASHREMELATQVKGMQLDSALGRADIKSMSDAFDSRVGKPGAFKDAIIEHGKSVWALSNYTVDLTPEQAVADFVKKYGNPSSFAGTAPAAEAATPTAATPSSANAQPPVKVIPNVAGRSSSPVKQSPKNLDDLKRLRDAAIKEDNASRSPSQGYLAG